MKHPAPVNFRKPVEGWHAARYMLILVVALAVTVMVTRVYLELAGYPQLGNATFHFAHALWGGLLQLIAAGLLLLFLNEWISTLSAALAGIGAGLFIDEIGKFITQTNDYFFPLAAPIIYVALILGVMLYLLVRRQEVRDARDEMYIVLEELKSLADQRMDAQQHTRLMNRLQIIAGQSERPDLASIAQGLLQSLPAEIPPDVPSDARGLNRFVERCREFEAQHFTSVIARRVLALFFLVAGALSVVEIVLLLAVVIDRRNLEAPLIDLLLQNNPLIRSPYSLNWYVTLMTVEAVVGVLFLTAFISFVRQHDRVATQIGTLGLVLSLTVGNTLAFYFEQFSVAVSSLILLIVLIVITRFRDRFLREDSVAQTSLFG